MTGISLHLFPFSRESIRLIGYSWEKFNPLRIKSCREWLYTLTEEENSDILMIYYSHKWSILNNFLDWNIPLHGEFPCFLKRVRHWDHKSTLVSFFLTGFLQAAVYVSKTQLWLKLYLKVIHYHVNSVVRHMLHTLGKKVIKFLHNKSYSHTYTLPNFSVLHSHGSSQVFERLHLSF